MSRLYRKPIQLGEVSDLEGLCRTMISRLQRRHGSRLRPHDQEDLVAYVVSETWAEVTKRLGQNPNGGSAGLAASIAWCQTVEWYRRRYGRTGGRIPLEQADGLDEAVAHETSERPLAAAYGQASPLIGLRQHERQLLVLADLSADELASRIGEASSREISRYRRSLRERLREVL